MIKSFKDLKVYQRSFNLAMDIFQICSKFPTEEKYSLTSQIIRSSRSISANISEGWAKREYENIFKQHLIHSLGSSSETQTWLSFAVECKYITNEEYHKLYKEIDEVCMMITKLHQRWRSNL